MISPWSQPKYRTPSQVLPNVIANDCPNCVTYCDGRTVRISDFRKSEKIDLRSVQSTVDNRLWIHQLERSLLAPDSGAQDLTITSPLRITTLSSFVRFPHPPSLFSFYTFLTHFIRLVVFTSASEPSKIKFRFYQTEGLTLSSILTSFKHNT